MFVDDIFASIQGESSFCGFPTVFCRMYGCNLKCAFCDQKQSKDSRKKMNAEAVLSAINKFHLRYVCFTGGEPLLQNDIFELIYTLAYQGQHVSIETNGSIPLSPDYYARSYKYIMDIKTPSSGMESNNHWDNMNIIHDNDEIKFVIADREDYEYALAVLKKYDPTCAKLFSPLFSWEKKQTIGADLAKWLVDDRINGRIQLQMHKVLGVK